MGELSRMLIERRSYEFKRHDRKLPGSRGDHDPVVCACITLSGFNGCCDAHCHSKTSRAAGALSSGISSPSIS